MENKQQIKKKFYALFEFSSIQAPFQEEAYFMPSRLINKDRIDQIKKRDFLVQIQSKNFFVWGFADILRLFIFDNIKGFAELQKLKPLNNIYDLKYSACSFSADENFNLKKILDEYPLMGISFLKFKDDIFKHIKPDKYPSFIHDFLRNKVRENLKEEISLVIPMISYGWEDVILLFFSKSYYSIKKSVLKLRGIETSHINEFLSRGNAKKFSFKHIFMNTFTIFTTHFPRCSKKEISESIALLKRRNLIDKGDKAYINGIKFQVRPGHIKMTEKNLKYRLGKRVKAVDIKPTPSRGDLLLTFKRDTNFYKFLDFYPSIAKIMKNKKSSIISLETDYAISKKLLEENRHILVNKKIRRTNIVTDRDIEVIKWLEDEKILEEHSLLGFTNLLSEASYFKNHYFIRQTMLSWINIVETLKSFLLYSKNTWPPLGSRDGPMVKKISAIKTHIYSQIEAFLLFLPGAFNDRFRGVYPMGEISTIPLLTYKTSLQKFLISIDYICIKIFYDVLRIFDLDRDYTYPKEFSFCSTFTTEFSPSVTNFLWLSNFIFVPDIFVYNLNYIPHEIGHTFIGYFAKHSLQKLQKKTSKVDRYIYKNRTDRSIVSEILADCFALFVGFKGDFGDFDRNFYDFYNTEGEIRKKAVKWLLNNIGSVSKKVLPCFINEKLDPLNDALDIILKKDPVLMQIFAKLKDERFSFQHFPYNDLFEKEKWLEFFIKFFSEVKN